MIACIQDNFFSKKTCEVLIKFYKKNKKHSKKFRDVYPLDINLSNDLVNKINSASILLNNSIVDWAQIVYWPKNSFQDLHYDIFSKKTTLSSICYLNDDFVGGETYFKDGTVFKPKKNRILFFDGNYYFHGVKKITSKNRYVLAIWYKKK